MFVWQHFENLSLDGNLKITKKSRLSYFYHWLYLCLLYQWNFLYWQLKEKEKKNYPTGCGPTATGSRVWFLVGVQNVRFWYKDFLEELWLGIFSLLFFILHISICFPFFFFFVSFLGKRVEEFSFWLINT